MARLSSLDWKRGQNCQRLLMAGDSWLVTGLGKLLALVDHNTGQEGQPDVLVIERGMSHTVSDEEMRAVDTILLIDPEDKDRHRVFSIKAGNPKSRIETIPSFAAIAAAEHAMLLMLALSRKLLPGYSAVVGGDWPQPSTGPVLRGRTLGIVGFGRSGQALAERALSFGMQVLFDDLVDKDEIVARLPVRRRRFDQILREADVVSLHLPASDDTFRLIDAPELATMKPSALLINVADGRLIDEGSLIKTLRNGDIAGAGLDAFAYEPLTTDSPLIGFENVVLTPRTAWMSVADERHQWLERITQILTES